MYKIGDMAVYPTQGVVVVHAIETKEYAGQTNDFYVLKIVDSDMTIMVPVRNAGQVGMRTPIARERVPAIFSLLEEEPKSRMPMPSWSRRQREYNEKLKTGDLHGVAEVLRELYRIRGAKELSYGEKKVLELARKLLVKEIALAEGAAEEAVVQRVEQIFLH